ncbi:hypothetical protein [Microscilla marina]|uniref:Uncharacterized protein n=1 Tax=Microscilla marina ATCC 23134 TaxID=313606 RepID=A1ZLI1_MICM2|nr:hypothetical protein [Microscilla marina]EAY28735.1 hypothetical protein M23134_07833 [Microscilla marina ATCC 23134]
MAYINKVKITIAEKYQIRSVNSIKIQSNWKNIAETCEVKIPNLEKYLNRIGSKTFKAGDKVKVELSMATSFNNDNFNPEFEGYIDRVQFSTPFTLFCENEAYIWKRKPSITKFYKEITINDLLKELFGDAVVLTESIPKLTLQKFKIEGATPYKVIKELKKSYFITAYFRGNKLLVGSDYVTELNTPTHVYHLDGDRGNIVKENLLFRSKDTIKLKAKAVSILRNGKKIEVSVGDPDGEERTLHFKYIEDEKVLKKLAKAKLEKLKQDTLEGAIETFGLPYVKHSHLAKLKSVKYGQKNGTFFIDGVDTSFSTEGFRRNVKLGKLMILDDLLPRGESGFVDSLPENIPSIIDNDSTPDFT